MDGIHDLGGMEGFGPIPIEENEPIFHADWEARAMALRMLMAFWGKWTLDAGRHSIETLPPSDYLGLSYYEKWLASLVNLSVTANLISKDEVASGRAAPDAGKATPPIDPDGWNQFLPRGRSTSRTIDTAPQFAVGDQVRTAEHMQSGPHRLPRYARGHTGEIILHHGGHVFPDTNGILAGEHPQHLYTVRFAARDLWGDEAAAQDTVTVDLWEGYLARA
jgi:nitrile hydratase subunit beta